MEYDLEMLVSSSYRDVERLTKRQLKNEFKFYMSKYEALNTMPYEFFIRVCKISDILFELRSAGKNTQTTANAQLTMNDIMYQLDNLYPDMEGDENYDL